MLFIAPMDIAGFAEWLQSELDNRGMSQADLSRSSGLSRAQVSRILRMKAPAGEKACAGIAQALNIPEELVRQKADLFRAFPPGMTDIRVDVLTTEVSTILLALPKDEREMVRDIARIFYRRHKRRTKNTNP